MLSSHERARLDDLELPSRRETIRGRYDGFEAHWEFKVRTAKIYLCPVCGTELLLGSPCVTRWLRRNSWEMNEHRHLHLQCAAREIAEVADNPSTVVISASKFSGSDQRRKVRNARQQAARRARKQDRMRARAAARA